MSTATATKTELQGKLDARILLRTVEEGYGPGAWHGNDLKAALADVSSEAAFWRPAAGRHNIAEIALHHAYCIRNVRAQITGGKPDAFVMEGEDWFDLPGESKLSWAKVKSTLEKEQQKLAAAFAALGGGKSASATPEQFDLALGITCHAIYHAGQVQLLKALRGT